MPPLSLKFSTMKYYWTKEECRTCQGIGAVYVQCPHPYVDPTPTGEIPNKIAPCTKCDGVGFHMKRFKTRRGS